MAGAISRPRLTTTEERWLTVLRSLNEGQARWYVADKALDLGRGGVSRLASVTGMSRTTITKGVTELTEGDLSVPPERIRQVGGGRKRVEQVDPALPDLLRRIVEESTAGEPQSPLRWTSKATRTIAMELGRLGHKVSAVTVGRCLHDLGYSLQANRKSKEGRQHADR